MKRNKGENMNEETFIKKMGVQSLFLAILAFAFSYGILVYNTAFLGISPFYYALVCAMLGGLQLIIAFDWYNDGARNRPFGLIPLYLIGIIIGAVIFFLIIVHIPLDLISQITSILKIEAVR